MRKIELTVVVAVFFLFSLPFATVFAEQTDSKEAVAKMMQDAAMAVDAAMIMGPVDVPFGDQAVFHLPRRIGFVRAQQAQQLLDVYGNDMGDNLIGLLLSRSGKWAMVVSYYPTGYVRDDDARSWDADKMLKNIEKGQAQSNATRRKRGLPELEILGWDEQPAYDEVNNRLIWSILTKHREASGQLVKGVNYNTMALGREGYISMNMATNLDTLESLKPVVGDMLASLEFVEGKRYADFDPKTDKVAAWGLAALIAGVAAKKFGLFAVIAAFVAKFAKVIGVVVVVLFGGLFRMFRKRS